MSWGPAPAAAAKSANGVISEDASVGAAAAGPGNGGAGGMPGAAMTRQGDGEGPKARHAEATAI